VATSATPRAMRKLEPEVEALCRAFAAAEGEAVTAFGPALVLARLSGIEAGLQALYPELVIQGALLVVGEDVVCQRQVLESLLGVLVTRVEIRVVLARQLAVRLAYLVGRGALRESEDGVQILRFRHRR